MFKTDILFFFFVNPIFKCDKIFFFFGLKNEEISLYDFFRINVSRKWMFRNAFFLLSTHETKIYPPEFVYVGLYPCPESTGSGGTGKTY